MSRRRPAGDHGVSSIELLLLTPLLLTFVLVVVQLGLIVQVRQAAQDAALAAARADRLAGDPAGAANAAVAAHLRPVQVSRAPQSPAAWTAHMQVRAVLPLVDVRVTRTAVLP